MEVTDLWGLLQNAVFYCINFFHTVFLDWGVAILVITIIFRLLITPLMYTQSKSTFMMQKVQPKLKEIQERFANDPVRMQTETQKIYADAKFNPLASCIPMLIQMPVFILLFQVLRGMAGTNLPENDATIRFHDFILSLPSGTDFQFLNLVPDLTQTPGGSIELVATNGVMAAVPYILLLAIFAFCTFIPSLLTMKNQDAKQRSSMMIMMVLMTIMMLFIGWSSPAGVLLFWGASSILAICQQQGSLALIKKKDKEAAEAAQVVEVLDIEVDRKPRKKRQHKKR